MIQPADYSRYRVAAREMSFRKGTWSDTWSDLPWLPGFNGLPGLLGIVQCLQLFNNFVRVPFDAAEQGVADFSFRVDNEIGWCSKHLPVIDALGLDPVWFGVLFIMSTEMGFLTPPYGVNLFYMKGVVPPSISMTDIYKSVAPFVLLQLTGLIIVMLVPDIALLLPTLIFG